MREKPVRCKHVWQLPEFIGDPIACAWSCRVKEHCACGKEREHHASSEEIQAEITRLMCSVCGLRLAHHDARLGTWACTKLLAARVEELEERLRSLEKWKES